MRKAGNFMCVFSPKSGQTRQFCYVFFHFYMSKTKTNLHILVLALELKCAFYKNDFIYECTSSELNIFRHQYMAGYLGLEYVLNIFSRSLKKNCHKRKLRVYFSIFE